MTAHCHSDLHNARVFSPFQYLHLKQRVFPITTYFGPLVSDKGKNYKTLPFIIPLEIDKNRLILDRLYY